MLLRAEGGVVGHIGYEESLPEVCMYVCTSTGCYGVQTIVSPMQCGADNCTGDDTKSRSLFPPSDLRIMDIHG